MNGSDFYRPGCAGGTLRPWSGRTVGDSIQVRLSGPQAFLPFTVSDGVLYPSQVVRARKGVEMALLDALVAGPEVNLGAQLLTELDQAQTRLMDKVEAQLRELEGSGLLGKVEGIDYTTDYETGDRYTATLRAHIRFKEQA